MIDVYDFVPDEDMYQRVMNAMACYESAVEPYGYDFTEEILEGQYQEFFNNGFDVRAITCAVFATNYRAWDLNNSPDLQQLYVDFFYRFQDLAVQRLQGEDLTWFYNVTD